MRSITQTEISKGILQATTYLVFALAFMFLPQSVKAQDYSGSVFFNELMWRGSSVSTADEWIELYNNSDEIVDISGWVIFDEDKGEVMIEIDKGKIAPRSFFLVSNNEKNHLFSGGESVLNIDPDMVSSKVGLSNDKLHLALKDGDVVVDRVGDGSKTFYKNTICSSDESTIYSDKDCKDSELNRSLQRINYQDGTLPVNWTSTKEADLITIESGAENIATPHNSGKPKILGFSLSNNLFFAGRENRYKVIYEIEDSVTDFKRLYLQVENGQEVSELIEVSSGEKISLSYNYCPKLIAISEDQTGLTDTFPLEISCVFFK